MSSSFIGRGDQYVQYKIQHCFMLLKPFHNCAYSSLSAEQLRNYISTQTQLRPLTVNYCCLVIEWLFSVPSPQAVNRTYQPRNHYTRIQYDHPPIDHLTTDATVAEVYELLYQVYICHRRKKQIVAFGQMRMIMEPVCQKPFRLMRCNDLFELTADEQPSVRDALFNVFRKMEQCAYAHDIVHSFHFTDYALPWSHSSKVYQHLCEEDVHCLLQHQGLFPVDLTLFFLYSGLTTSEAVLFSPDWIDFHSNEIITHHPQLQVRERIIPIHANLIPILQRWSQIPENQFFLAAEGGRLRNFDLTQLVKLTGLAYLGKFISPGDCRHYFQVRLENTTATPTQMAVLLGKRPIGTGGMVYTHPTAATLHAIIRQIP